MENAQIATLGSDYSKGNAKDHDLKYIFYD